LPLWFSLATHGIKAYREAVAHNVELAREIADEIKRRHGFRLVREPELSVVVFTRDGWTIDDYNAWSDRLLQDGIAFVVPSSHRGEPNTRFAIVNPETSYELLTQILDSMETK
jgi:glutamate/tyrosine decarboxylase-like PLP-dependent enzyme